MKRRGNPVIAFLREPITVAIVAALVVAGALAFVVLAFWPGEATPGTTLSELAANPSPTPRTVRRSMEEGTATTALTLASPAATLVPQFANVAIAAVNATATTAPESAAPPATTVPPTATPRPSPTPAPPTVPPTVVATRQPTVTATATATATEATAPLFRAETRGDFAALAAGRWEAQPDRLAVTQPPRTAEPWLVLPATAASGDFAIEAEIRVIGLTPGVCNQNFGLVLQRGNLARGGGVIYPCGNANAEARITDPTIWTDGYDQDLVLGRDGFDPGRRWHSYRLEVRGSRLTLFVDDSEVVTTDDPAFISQSGTTGLWTQGVELEVRRIDIVDR